MSGVARFICVVVLVIAGISALPGIAYGTTTVNWVGTSGNWNVSGNWSGSPNGTKDAVIDNGGQALLPAGVVGFANFLLPGYSGTGGFSITGGTFVCDSTFLASAASSKGNATISNGSWSCSEELAVGVSGTASLSVSGGSITDSFGDIGLGTGSGTVNFSGGSWSNYRVSVGFSGNGALNLSGGSIGASYECFIGWNATATGIMTVTGGTFGGSFETGMYIGGIGTGVLNVCGGTVVDAAGVIGESAGGHGVATVSSGTWNNTISLYDGLASPGILNLTGSGVIVIASGTGQLSIGQGSIMNLGNGGTAGILKASVVASSGTMNFNHTGTYTFTQLITGSGCVVDCIGAGTTILAVHNTYNGITMIHGGAILANGVHDALPDTNTSGVTVNALLLMGDPNDGAVNNGYDMAGCNQIVGGLISSVSDSSIQSVYNSAVNSTSILTINALAGSGGTFNGAIKGASAGVLGDIALVKDGGGMQVLGGLDTYTAGTTIKNGLLVIDGTQNGGMAYVVSAGGALGGNGLISPASVSGTGSAIVVSGTLSPGNPSVNNGIGVLTLDGKNVTSTLLSMQSGGALVFTLGANSTGSEMAIINGQASDVSFQGNSINFNDTLSGGLSPGYYVFFHSDAGASYTGVGTDSNSTITSGINIGTGLEKYPGSTLKIVGNDIVINIVQTALNNWRHANFGTYINTGSAADTANPTHDGIVNLVKYATGIPPLTPSPNPPIMIGQATVNGLRYLTLSFNMIADPKLVYSVEGTNDLVSDTWSNVWSSTGTTNIAGNVSVQDSVPLDQEPKRFLRLTVTY